VHYADPGYLMFVRESTLVAQPFDPWRRELRGEAVPVGDKLSPGNLGLGAYSTSKNGVLAFRPGAGRRGQLSWFDRGGKEVGIGSPDAQHLDFALSPDGTRLALDVAADQGRDVWVRDLQRGTTTRFTFDKAADGVPVWTPDGRSIIFASDRAGPMDLYIKNAAGTGEERLLYGDKDDKFPTHVSPDGRYLVYMAQGTGTGLDIRVLPLTGEPKPTVIAATPFNEISPTLSPDGRFIAYHSNESGRAEVYVHEFPEPKSKWQVSTAGGRQASWSADGKELYYLAPDGGLMGVPVALGEGLQAGTPEKLFQPRLLTLPTRWLYRPAKDGRFLVHTPLEREATPPITVVVNWPEAVRR
ncbi:MAG TPA: hypothetical protein VFM29_04545, partial [Vicinamibacteria bacterium]|nr:hypothetical protein [Vicinamibacteria bacterium]